MRLDFQDDGVSFEHRKKEQYNTSMQMSAIKIMEEKARSMSDVVSLSQGIPFSPSHDRIRSAVIQALLANNVDQYSSPQGLTSLREMIAVKLQQQQMVYHPDEIIVTAGAIEAMTAVMLALFEPGDEIIIPTPIYAAFFRCAAVAKLSIIEVPLKEENGWKLDFEKLQQVMTARTKAILLCNPNNPTGSVYPRETLQKLAQFATKKKVFVLLDEVYRQMYFGSTTLYSPCEEREYRKFIIRIVSFSKDFSLTGWRVGFLHTDRDILKRILPVHDAIVNCAPVISQYAAMAALVHEAKIVSELHQQYTENRELMGEYLESLREYLSFQWPQGSYFFFPKIYRCNNSQQLCLDILQKVGVALVPGSDFGQGGEGHIRLCFGRKKEDIEIGMGRFSSYLKQI